MAAHAQVSGVVEEDDARGAGRIDGLNQQCSYENFGTARLAKDGAAVEIVFLAQALKALGE
jgi:hypothetical protein